MPFLTKIRDQMWEVAEAVGNASISSGKKGLLKNILMGIVEKQLEGVRPDQLKTHILDAESTVIFLDKQGLTIPPKWRNIISRVNRIVNVNRLLREVEPTIDKRVGYITMQAIREKRPDLYEVIKNTQGGQSMIYDDAFSLWIKVKEEIREIGGRR